MTSVRFAWTDEKVGHLKAMYAEKCLTADIAEALGTSRNSVIGKAKRLGISMEMGPHGPWTPDRIATLRQMWSNGRSATEIGEILGVSRKVISAKAVRLDLPVRRSHSSVKTKIEVELCKPLAVRKPPPPASDQKEYILGQGILLLDLAPHHCRWPINSPAPKERYLFCGGTIYAKGSPYCEYHARWAYRRAA